MILARRLELYYCSVFLGLIFLSNSDGQCNVCSLVNNLACVSPTEFQFCTSEVPVGSILSCPAGYVCSVGNSPVVCQPESDVVATCNECKVCDANNIFACTGPRTYALCLNSTSPSTSEAFCPLNYVCSIHAPYICGETSLGFVPSCLTGGQETTTISPTTVSPLQFPQRYCRNLGQYGRFPVGRNANNTCRQYVFCFLNSGVWSGQLYNCPGRTFFNSTSRLCVDQIPEDCSF